MKFRFETNEMISNIFSLVISINKSNNLTARVLPQTGMQQTFIVEIEDFKEFVGEKIWVSIVQLQTEKVVIIVWGEK